MTIAAIKPTTIEEFLQLPETEPASEFIHGQITQKPMPQGEHSQLQIDLCETINQITKLYNLDHSEEDNPWKLYSNLIDQIQNFFDYEENSI